MSIPTKYDWKKLEDFCSTVLENAGVSKENARIVATSLIEADLRGVDSHGVVRTAIYLERIERGMINPNATVTITSDSDSAVLVDGNNNFGSVVGTKALEIALEKAKRSGVALIGVKHSNHFGTGAYYAKKAIEKDIILLVLSNASQTMPPTGGVRPFIGTNPLA
ncbi:(R)-2-hydroxyacid dehydrogenase [Halalkalibacter wakoensis JCM 9140]|uniref:(R)-2-hydroxyacid dehydrogenase n=1 Tax=Halalkalibacter wakoensis JCM 9140 TaxID=1236970 RepID=W4Q2N5_9BACI|nr:(R)-2-hydroxyacid dehydrogenase [Halalkalibacter wakoensis JCM 9140]